ncbi:hypothetical protein [Calothrix sp. PCC 7507]|uniref:hypothetical protein n=1 Tax=Calothrix sp. PCC 7507 TaxID=99598 RepID=UPI00029ED556|nr:hypothetical protein [Calothrix sp. PCC 7507]AFY31616.1 hypothetical protein Cal7507_1142 [Calothrix sp. PCC 7507]
MTNLAQDLQALEAHILQIIKSPEWIAIIAAGIYSPEITLGDALQAAREAVAAHDLYLEISFHCSKQYSEFNAQ